MMFKISIEYILITWNHFVIWNNHFVKLHYDFKIDNNFNIIKFFFNSLINKYNLKVNFSKDLIVKKSNAFNYPEFKLFKKEISLLNYKKKINSFFSKRLKI